MGTGTPALELDVSVQQKAKVPWEPSNFKLHAVGYVGSGRDIGVYRTEVSRWRNAAAVPVTVTRAQAEQSA